jgi:hypothetical protein
MVQFWFAGTIWRIQNSISTPMPAPAGKVVFV